MLVLYRILLAVPLLLLWTLLLLPIFVLLCAVSSSFAFTTLGPLWGRGMCLLTPIKMTRLGVENIRQGQSYVVIANHSSQYDIPIVCGYLPLNLKWVAKKELMKHPIIGPASLLMGNVFVDRSNTDAAIASLQRIKSRIHGGTSLMFFPEGTRSKLGHMLPFKNGAFIMAKELGLPILPVSIVNADNILAAGHFFPQRGDVQFYLHPEISADEVQSLELADLVQKGRSQIQRVVEPDRLTKGEN